MSETATPSFSVIIPSKTDANLGRCVRACREQGVAGRIIVMDDFEGETRFLTPELEPVDWQKGIKPFCFARNMNMGIRAAGNDDVVLLNDDALLETPGGFSLLAHESAAHPEFGVIGATTNVTGYPAQWRKSTGLRQVEKLAFVCVYIPRRTLAAVGLLDERFTSYGGDDIDYCRRVRAAGLKVGVHDGCFVDHGSLRSTFRGDPFAPGDIVESNRVYQEKWGDLR
jgi:glycosyltransferase involved in cell wall biosynthesis